MNKKFFSFVLIIALLTGAIYFSKTLTSPLISTLNGIKSFYLNSIESVQYTINKHFFQAQMIDTLTQKLKGYENDALVMQQLAYELNDIYKENNATLTIHPKVTLVRALAYEKFGNFNRLWIDFSDFNSSKIYGLVYKDYVAGIVVAKNNLPLALLNKDIKSTYAVTIGKSNAPGIAHGNNDAHIIVNFIPAWFEIKIGDEVITSGLDTIFFKGLKVGKVIKITKAQGYQSAVVEQYYTQNDPNYFYLIEETK